LNYRRYIGAFLLSYSIKSLTDALFTVYGSVANKSLIKTYIKVTGVQSGAVRDVTVIINKNL
jgi:hypothetical protein